jgi:hypothetical protein
MPALHPSFAEGARFRPAALFVALSAVFLPAAEVALAGTSNAFNDRASQPRAPQNWVVQNCSDGPPGSPGFSGSLRDLIESPNNAQSGDTVDLSQLPALCGTAGSKITLTAGEIVIHQDKLTLLGPDAAAGTVTISGGGQSRIFNHQGIGTVSIDRLEITEGFMHAAGNAYGGCIYGSGMDSGVYLYEAKVTACVVSSDSGAARGGAIRAADVGLVLSEVSGSSAETSTGHAYGGGVHANTFFASYGTISNNEARQGQNSGSRAGGVYAAAGITVFNSTIDHNHASYGGGFLTRSASMLVNSTLTDNVAEQTAGAWYALGSSLSIWNSTVSFNKTNSNSIYGAVTFHGTDAASSLDVRSSIIAKNTVGQANVENDVFILPGFGTLAGQDNLIMASNVSDPVVIVSTDDPKLGALRFNGGPTQTRLLPADSPARDIGINVGSPTDQRGRAYPRSSGLTTDIGAVQFDEIFPATFD